MIEIFVEKSVAFFPLSLGGVYKIDLSEESLLSLDSLFFAYSIFTTQDDRAKQDDYFTNIFNEFGKVRDYGRSVQRVENFQHYAASFAFDKNEQFSFGFSVIVNRYLQETISHQSAIFQDDSFLLLTESTGVTLDSLSIILGSIWTFETLKIGASFLGSQEPYPEKHNIHRYRSEQDGRNYQPENSYEHADTIEALDVLLPSVFRLGLAYYFLPSLLISADLSYSFAKGNTKVDHTFFDMFPTFNYSLGAEYSTSSLVFRTGFFTNNDRSKNIEKNLTGQQDHIDYLGFSFSLGYIYKKFISSLGVSLQQGGGELRK